MAEVTSQSRVLIFEQRRPLAIFFLPCGLVAAAIVAALSHSMEAEGSVLLFSLLACMFLWMASQRTTVQVDLRARRLRISRRFVGHWVKSILDCPLDQCRVLGRIEYDTDGHSSYGVYVELASGSRHGIPIKEDTIQEAGRVAAQLSEATGIPRLDTKF